MRIVLFAFFLFCLQSVVAQDRRIDSVQSFLKNHPKEDSTKADALNKLSELYQWNNFYRALEYADKAAKLSRELNYKKGIATADYLKGHCYWALGDADQSIAVGLEAISLATKNNYSIILAEAQLILSRSYLDQTEMQKATGYVRQAEKIAIEKKDWDLLARAYNFIGVIKFVVRQKDSALYFYNKAYKIAHEHSTPKVNWARTISNIGECYLESNFDLAFNYFQEALSIAQETNNRSVEAGTTSIMGNALIKKGKYAEANNYLQSSLKLSRELGLRRVIRHAYAGLVDLNLKLGKAPEAVAYLRNYYEIRDSLINASKTRQIVELETKHEIEKKEQDILLLQQEKKIQQIWNNILISVLIIIGIASIGVYQLQQYREQKNRQILNLEIDRLTTQQKDLSEKYKDVLASSSTKPTESSDQRMLRKAIEIVESNMGNSLFGVEELAKELGMSRTNMHRKIKAITGFAPSELIRSIRLRKAAALLLSKADSVSQIGFIVGFEDHSYFTKSFKKEYGVTPSEYAETKDQSE
ncbi:MAG: helix-turn-helix domain-containing protein [Cyclobacteriaceae bacterium]